MNENARSQGPTRGYSTSARGTRGGRTRGSWTTQGDEPRPRPAAALAPLLAMLEGVSGMGLVELERLLSSQLRAPAPTPAEVRVGELFALTQLLESDLAVFLPHHPLAPVQVSQVDYNRARPTSAPTAEMLVERYGGGAKDGWAWACRAAWGLLPDGRKTKPGIAARPYTQRGRRRPPRSDRDHVIASIRQCAFALLRRPSSNMYNQWVNAQRRRGKTEASNGHGASSATRHPASMPVVYQQFPKGWASALAAAHITDDELLATRLGLTTATLSPDADPATGALGEDTVADQLAAFTSEQLSVLGLSEKKRDRLVRKGCGELALSQAVSLATTLGCSLDWLAEQAHTMTDPPAFGTRFDPDAVRALAHREGVQLTALAARAGLDVSGWRAVMTGKGEPTLGQLTKIADALRSHPTQLTVVLA